MSKFFQKSYSLLIVYYWAIYVFLDFSQKSDSLFDLHSMLQLFPVIAFVGISIPLIMKRSYKKEYILIIGFTVLAVLFALYNNDIIGVVNILVFSGAIYTIYYYKLVLSLKLINFLFILSVIISIVSTLIGLNEHGFIPGQYFGTSDFYLSGEGALWRVSLFPFLTTPFSGAFSLIVFVCNYLYKYKSKINYLILFTSLYYIVFSANRTVIIILLSLVLFEFLYKRKNYFLKKLLPALVLSGTIILTVTPILLHQFDTGPVTNALLYRSTDKPDIFALESNTRVILWNNILYVYNQSPITGVGNFDLYEYVPDAPSHSECKWLSLLARYGIATILLFFFIYSRYLISLKRDVKSEAWVSIMIIMYMMFYGSFMEVYNLIFFIMLGLNNISYKNDYN